MARREHTRLELKRKLLARGLSEQIIEQALDGIAARGLQSDARFVESYVRERAQKGYGPLRITEELKVRGVEETLIHQYIGEPEWEEHLSRVRTKRFGSGLPKDREACLRQARFLQYRGFTSDQIRRLMREGDA